MRLRAVIGVVPILLLFIMGTPLEAVGQADPILPADHRDEKPLKADDMQSEQINHMHTIEIEGYYFAIPQDVLFRKYENTTTNEQSLTLFLPLRFFSSDSIAQNVKIFGYEAVFL